MPIQAPNWSEAREFLNLIAGCDDPVITFQVFDDKAERFDIAEWHHGKLSDDRIRAWLIAKAAEGCGIFFTLNECDGHGRRRENVTRGRVLGIDFDGTPLPKEQPRPFDITVESSPGKYHGYYLIDPTEDLVKWSDTQAQLAEYYDADRKVFDPPRVFRLPGFYHQKGQPFRTRILSKCSPDQAAFERAGLDEIRADHPCEYRAPSVQTGLKGSQNGAFEDHERDIEFVSSILSKTCPAEGERNNIAYRMACLCNDYGISPEKASELLLEWNDENGVGLPEGEIAHVINSAGTYKNSPAGVKASIDAKTEFEAAEEVDPAQIKIGGDGAVVEKKNRSRFIGQKIDDLLALPAPKWLVKNLFIEGGLFEIYGKFKSGKTFWAVELSCCIATGHDFFGSPTRQGKVLYIIAEGSRKLFAYRMDAWARARANGDESEYLRLRELLNENIRIVTTSVQINNAETVKAFLLANRIDENDKRALVVIDTLFRNFQGNVSEAEAFSKFIEGCDLIRRVLHAAVLFLHHQKRNDGVGGFGSVVGEASVDAAAKVSAPDADENELEDDTMKSTLVPELMRDGELADAWNCIIDVVKIDDPTLAAEDVNTVGVLRFKSRGGGKGKKSDAQILQTIVDSDSYNYDALAAALSKSRSSVEKYCQRLRDRKLIESRSGKGGFKLTKVGLAMIKRKRPTPQEDFPVEDGAEADD